LRTQLNKASTFKYGAIDKYYNDTLNAYSIISKYYALTNESKYERMIELFTPVVNTFYKKSNLSQDEILDECINHNKLYTIHVAEITDSTFQIFNKIGDALLIRFNIMYFMKRKTDKKLKIYKVLVVATVNADLKISFIKEESITPQ
jgi:hypothetical protein